MNKYDIKEYLQEYRSCMARAQRLKVDIERFSASAASIKREMEDCVSRSLKIEELISTHKNLMEREVLTRKYIYGDTLEVIAETLCYSPRHIQRIIDKAAEKIGEKMCS